MFPFHFTENTVPIFCVEPSPGAGALIKSEAPKKAPDGPKMGGSGEKAPAPAPEHWNNLHNITTGAGAGAFSPEPHF